MKKRHKNQNKTKLSPTAPTGTDSAEPPLSWAKAFQASPGPDDIKGAGTLLIKGMCMGAADIVPGVSGGTVALITGIYARLIMAIRSADMVFFKHVVGFDFKQALSRLHVRFLFPLCTGIASAIIGLSGVIHFLLLHYTSYIYCLFFGLIIASAIVIAKQITHWGITTGIAAGMGVIIGYIVAGAVPHSTPDTMPLIFFSGFIAICAMILPGISGAFILLILGKYEMITQTLKNPFLWENTVVIMIFCAGCLAGLLVFARFLGFLLAKHYAVTMAFLSGLMCGSLRKVWPWKNDGLENILPPGITADLFVSVGLVLTGVSLIFLLNHLSKDK